MPAGYSGPPAVPPRYGGPGSKYNPVTPARYGGPGSRYNPGTPFSGGIEPLPTYVSPIDFDEVAGIVGYESDGTTIRSIGLKAVEYHTDGTTIRSIGDRPVEYHADGTTIRSVGGKPVEHHTDGRLRYIGR